ncbi:MAG: Rhodanese domain protein [Bacillales bacterium]|nr:Rhodanese domain protein [Bacillales bacterium]
MEWWILGGVVALYVAYIIYNYLTQRKASKVLTEAEFIAGYRKGQLIDVREDNEFKAGHILGARNLPMSMFRRTMTSLRKDMPVYLYCQNQIKSSRAASMLYKAGFKEIYQLQGGFKLWTGKIKK